MCTDEDCGACQNDNNQSQRRVSSVRVHGAPHCASGSGIIGASPIEFLKWTKVQRADRRKKITHAWQAAPLGIKRHEFQKRDFNNIVQKSSREERKKNLGNFKNR
jgi:hypothetical protein